jgi:hypothetical protein
MNRVLVLALVVLAALGAVLWLKTGEERREVGPVAPPPNSAKDRNESALETAITSGADTEREEAQAAAQRLESERSDAADNVGLAFGRVVDALRLPAAAVEIELHVDGRVHARSVTSERGEFELRGAALVDPISSMVLARAADGTLARRVVTLGPERLPRYVARSRGARGENCGVLVLLPVHTLEVDVSGADGEVTLRATSSASPALLLATATLVGDGRVQLNDLPAALVRVEATSTTHVGLAQALVPVDRRVSLVLEPTVSCAVEVVDARSGAPIASAELGLSELRRIPMTFESRQITTEEYPATFPLQRPAVLTDDAGFARFDGLRAGARYELSARAAGYLDAPGPPGLRSKTSLTLKLDGVTRIELQPGGARTVRWPIETRSVPPPPEGAEVEVRFAPGMQLGADDTKVVALGRMRGAELVVENISFAGQYLGRAPDGSLAALYVSEESDVGRATHFERPRAIDVTVRSAAGALVEGVTVQARNQGNNPLGEFVRTNAAGFARLGGLYPQLVDVQLYDPLEPQRSTLAGSADLREGDGRVEFTLAARFEAIASVSVDGAARLPAEFTCSPPPREELPATGELRFELASPAAGEAAAVSLSAPGFASASAKVTPTRDGTPARFRLELVSTGELHVRVNRATDEPVELALEQFSAKSNEWSAPQGMLARTSLRVPNGAAGGFRFAGLSVGRWRVFDRVSGSISSEAELSSAVLSAQVELSIVPEQWIRGRVVGPPDIDFARVRVLVDGAPVRKPQRALAPGDAPPTGAAVDADGGFEVRVPGDREVVVRPWHPWLAPSAASVLRTRNGREDVELELVAGRELRLPIANAELLARSHLRIAAFESGAESGPTRWLHATVTDGVARSGELGPGTWNLWVDAGDDWAPLRLERVRIDERGATLEPLQFTHGSSLRVRVLTPDGASPPRLFVSAMHSSEPKFWRSLNSNGESEVVLRGLCAGRFSVSVNAIMGDHSRPARELEFDGVGEVTIDWTP